MSAAPNTTTGSTKNSPNFFLGIKIGKDYYEENQEKTLPILQLFSKTTAILIDPVLVIDLSLPQLGCW